jgi:hypothetical protein
MDAPLVMLLALWPVLTIGAVVIDLLFADAPRRGKWPFPERRVVSSRLGRLENRRRVLFAHLSRAYHHTGAVTDDTHRP